MKKYTIYIVFAALLLGWACTGVVPGTCPPCPICPPTDTTVVVVDTSRSFGLIIGSNSNHYQPKDRQTAMQGIRLYYPLHWAYTSKGWYGQPMLQAQKQFLGLDDYLQHMNNKGVDVVLCLMQSPDWMNGQSNGTGGNDFPPIRAGLDRTDPKSYAEVAAIYRAFAIRYGPKTYPPGSYPLDPAGPRWNGDAGQEYKSGLNLVKYIEIGNEPDRWWDKGTPKYMNAEEYAAMLTACYEAIKGTGMGAVMAGLTNNDIPYLKAMQAKFTSLGKPFLSDAISIHHYSSYGNLPGIHPPTWRTNEAAPPEFDKDFATISEVVAWAKIINKPVWMGEYGYDTQPGSQMYPTPFGGKTSEQIQSEWLPRATLEYIRLGVERAYLFNMADEPNPNSGTFSSSGILYGEPAGYAPKPSFAAMAGLCELLKGAKYIGDRSTPTIRIMEFAKSGKIIFAYWLPTADSRVIQGAVAGKNVSVTETPQYLVSGVLSTVKMQMVK